MGAGGPTINPMSRPLGLACLGTRWDDGEKGLAGVLRKWKGMDGSTGLTGPTPALSTRFRSGSVTRFGVAVQRRMQNPRSGDVGFMLVEREGEWHVDEPCVVCSPC